MWPKGLEFLREKVLNLVGARYRPISSFIANEQIVLMLHAGTLLFHTLYLSFHYIGDRAFYTSGLE